MTCARCGVPATHHEITLPANASRLVGGCPGFATLHPPRRHQAARLALRAWWARQQRPTAASASVAPYVVRPRFGSAVWLFVAFLCLSAAIAFGIHTAAEVGWPLVEIGLILSFCGVGCTAALLLEFPALTRRFR